MHLAGGTFQEMLAFLQGYGLAMHLCHPEVETELDRFNRWATQRYSGPESITYIYFIARKYPDDASRFRRLQFVFNKFVKAEAQQATAGHNS